MRFIKKEINYFIEQMNNDYPISYLKSLMYEFPKLTNREQTHLYKEIYKYNLKNEKSFNQYLNDIDIYNEDLVKSKLESIHIKERLDILWKYYRYLDLKDILFYIVNMNRLMKYNN